MKTQGLTIIHGDTTIFDVFITQDGVPLNVTGATFWFTAKYLYTDADNATGAFQLYSPSNGITITDATGGKIRITIPTTATSSLPYVATVMVYDLQMKDASTNIRTLTGGNLTVLPDATRTTT